MTGAAALRTVYTCKSHLASYLNIQHFYVMYEYIPGLEPFHINLCGTECEILTTERKVFFYEKVFLYLDILNMHLLLDILCLGILLLDNRHLSQTFYQNVHARGKQK